MPSWVYSFIAVAVTLVWAGANVAAWLQGVAVQSEIHLVMGALVGGTFGGQAISRQRERERGADRG